MTEPAPEDAPEDTDPAPQSLSAQPVPAQTLPAFTPVPREKDRCNGWKPEVQRAFIEALAETGSVRSACRAVGRADHGAYLLRRHPDAEQFRRAWDAALDIGMRRIEDVAMDRALHGHQQPVYSYGKLVGERTVYNDRLLMFMLRNRAPERFGGGTRKGTGAAGENAVDRMELARLKKRWRKEWEREKAEDEPAELRRIQDSLDTKLDRMRENWLKSMSPHVRALYRAYEQAAIEEEQHGPPKGLPLLPGVAWPESDPGEMDEAEWEELVELDARGIEPVPPLEPRAAEAEEEEEPAPPPGRVIDLKGDGWSEPWRGVPDDGRAQPWP